MALQTWSKLKYCVPFDGNRLWAPCTCLSWSAVAFSRSIDVELDSVNFHWTRALARISSFNLNFGHTHASCNAVPLVGLAQAHPNKAQVHPWRLQASNAVWRIYAYIRVHRVYFDSHSGHVPGTGCIKKLREAWYTCFHVWRTVFEWSR